MKNLLDTHTLIWFLNGDNLISKNARKAIESKNAENYISIVSLWEMAIKISLKRLEINIPFSKIETILNENNFVLLPITINDLITLSTLPFYHNDPFDRLLISQTKTNNFILISKDQFFEQYDTKLMW